MSAAGIIGLYERHAGAWAELRSRSPFIERRWLEKFRALLPQTGSVLDLGCGAGEPIARWLIEKGMSLTGVDSSPSLIGVCRNRFPSADWIEADMRTLSLSRRFDGVVAWHSFFHLSPDDQRSMFDVFAHHIARGGVLLFTSGGDENETFGEFQGEPLYHASLAPEEYHTLLDSSGFDLVERMLDDPDCGGAAVWLARRRADPAQYRSPNP